jgi:enamine deaminase RidA (YjgF/YER057c/UK114 family)
MSKRDVIVPDGMKATYDSFHFAPAVRHGDRLYCSGQVGTGPDGRLPSDPEAQFVNAFESVKSVLEAAGASLDDVVEMTTFHVGFGTQIASFMQVKDRYMREPYPAWTAVGVSELAMGALVEIKVIASLD